jgi:hypothetical protein
MPISTEEGAAYVVGSTAFVAMLFKFGKYAMQTLRLDKVESTIVQSDIASYKRLLEEIARLKEELQEQREYVRNLEERFDRLRDIELEGAADLGMLMVHIQNMPCGKCSAPAGTFEHIEIILERMMKRRNDKARVFQETANE